MGADLDPQSILHAIETLPPEIFQDTQFVLFSSSDYSTVAKLPISFYPCKSVIQMDDSPVQAVKRKKDSSLMCGVQELANHNLDAFISCANTGALVVASYLHLKPLAGVLKPALATCVPTAKGKAVVLDVGATPKCSEKDLVQFAYLGSAYAKCMQKKEQPKVGLLNIGVEYGKGTDELNRALLELTKHTMAPFSFVGNVEPRHVFAGQVDVVVTSGFTGNIFIKTAEAVASYLLPNTKGEGAGAFLLGVNGTVCKCHGQATVASIQKAIETTKIALKNDLVGYCIAHL